jgi:hypothetical protein
MPAPSNHKLYIGDPQFPTVFSLEETTSLLDGTASPVPVYRVTVYRPNDLDFYDPIIEFEQEFEHYGTALVQFSTQLQEHSNFVAQYEGLL